MPGHACRVLTHSCDVGQLRRVDHHVDFVTFIALISVLGQLTEKLLFVEIV